MINVFKDVYIYLPLIISYIAKCAVYITISVSGLCVLYGEYILPIPMHENNVEGQKFYDAQPLNIFHLILDNIFDVEIFCYRHMT